MIEIVSVSNGQYTARYTNNVTNFVLTYKTKNINDTLITEEKRINDLYANIDNMKTLIGTTISKSIISDIYINNDIIVIKLLYRDDIKIVEIKNINDIANLEDDIKIYETSLDRHLAAQQNQQIF